MMRAARCQGQSQFAGYYCYRGEPVVRLAGEAPFRYAGHAVVNGEQAPVEAVHPPKTLLFDIPDRAFAESGFKSSNTSMRIMAS